MAPGRSNASVEPSWISGDMIRVLAELQDSGIIHFQRSLTRSRDHNGHKFGTDVQLVLPPSFLQEHGGNFEEYVILRTRTSPKPWVVQVSIFEEADAVEVKFAGGWEEFAADNRLKAGDTLILVLNVPLPEFIVYIFRESRSSSPWVRNWFNTDYCTRVSEQKDRSLSHGHREAQQKSVTKTEDLLAEKKAVHERQQDLPDSVCDEEYSGQSHFHKTLARRSQHLGFTQCNLLTLPLWFVEEHGDKFEEWAILRTLSSPKPWRVHLKVRRTSNGNPEVQIRGGWSKFAAENYLKEGDSLVFVLNVDARSEFQVYIFRGTGRPGLGNPQTAPARNTSGLKSSGRHKLRRSGGDGSTREKCGEDVFIGKKKKAEEAPSSSYGVQESSGFTASEEATFTSSECKGEIRPPQHGTHSLPSFCRRLMGCNLMEVPASFVRTHWKQLQAEYVKVQGVHQESLVQVVKLRWQPKQPRSQPRLHFHSGWREFVNANGLQQGHELQFTLIADSFFAVRAV